MKFLVIAQDLRVSGTSEGIVSRSFVAKLKKCYPESFIKVVYLKHSKSDDRLDLLPVDEIDVKNISIKIPFSTIWKNKIYWRLKHRSLKEQYIQDYYKKIISKIEFEHFDHIFVRSSGLEYESILALRGLPILKRAIINFHDPYPVFWDNGSKTYPAPLELFRFQKMWDVVKDAKTCITPANLLSQDLQFLYGSVKPFHTLPHQFDKSVFDLSDNSKVLEKKKRITISYHGAVQFGRNIDILLDAYSELVLENDHIAKETEIIFRLRGSHNKRLIQKYQECDNISILDCLEFSNSANEQMSQGDIFIILENCSVHSNILVGKAPFLASLNRPILSLSPIRSEMRYIIEDPKYTATCFSKSEIKEKLLTIIDSCFKNREYEFPFGDYFSDENFKRYLDSILNQE